MNIYQKLIEVRKVAPYLKKENQSTQYKYVSSSQVLQTLKAKMDELQLLLIPKVTGHNVIPETVEYIDTYKGQDKPKKTTTYFTELEMEFTWVNAESPEETIICPWYGQGVDIAGEKGVGKALTYAEKYFMLKFFNIATDKDDPDAPQHNASKPEQKQQKADPPPKAAKPANKPPAKASREQLDTIFTLAKELNIPAPDMKEIIYATTEKNGSKELSPADADKVIEYLKKEAAAV